MNTVKKRLLSLIIFIGSFACAMDGPSAGELPKKKQRTDAPLTEQNKKQKYQIERDNQTIEITQNEFNALKNQSVTIANTLEVIADLDVIEDDEDIISIPTGIIPVNFMKQRILPLLVLINQNKTNELQDKLKNASLEDLISILETANYLDSETLLENCINQIASKELQLNNLKVLELLESRLPAEMYLMIGSQLLKNNPHIISTLLQSTIIPCHTLTCQRLHNIINTSSVEISSDNTKVITCSGDRAAKIWDMRTGQCLKTLTGHTGSIFSVDIISDSTKSLNYLQHS